MRNKTYIIISIFIIILGIVGVTFALVYYRSDTTSVNLNSEASISGFINYESGNPVLGSEGKVLEASSSYNDGLSTEIEFWKTENAKNMDIYGHIYIDIVTGSNELLNMEGLKWAVTSNNGGSQYILISEGNFVNYEEGDSVPILVNHKLLSNLTNFQVFIWLDEGSITDTSIRGESFSTSVRCEATTSEYDSSIYKIVLSDGLTSSEYTFDFIDDTVQEISLPSGTYKLEVWGAQGGYGLNDTYRGGYGGYSVGEISLNTPTTMYVVVGGQGGNGTEKVNTLNAGGYNGGGNSYGTTSKYVGSGGGATHIALSTGVLSDLSGNVDDILIVAGAGGGGAYESSSYTSTGGDAGGYIGNAGTTTNSNYAGGSGGTQLAGGAGAAGLASGSFGQGGNSTSDSIGGGGGFYGGGVGKYSSGGGGGSGYIQNSLLTDKAMYCYICQTSEDELTKTISVEDASETPVSGIPKIGNGYAKITAYGFPVSKLLPRVTISYGENYDFKTMISNEIDNSQNIIYSTYTNANVLSVGEYQIKYVTVDEEDNEYIYYQKVEIK